MKFKKSSKSDLTERLNTVFDAVNESRIGPVFVDGERKQASVLASQVLQIVIQSIMEE